jgi:hypothetical protein
MHLVGWAYDLGLLYYQRRSSTRISKSSSSDPKTFSVVINSGDVKKVKGTEK